jgi:hypothetical protein
MKQECPQEEVVARAIRAGEWPAGLAAHAAECALCRDVAQTAHWMCSLASSFEARSVSSQPTRAPHDPGLAWQRARLAGEQARAEKIFTVLEWVQAGSAAAAPVGLAGWVAWNWYAIEGMAGQFLLDAWPQLSSASYALASLAPAALTLAALALGYPLLASD